MRIILNDVIDPVRAINLIRNKTMQDTDWNPGHIGGWYGGDGLHTNYRVTKKGTVSVWQYQDPK